MIHGLILVLLFPLQAKASCTPVELRNTHSLTCASPNPTERAIERSRHLLKSVSVPEMAAIRERAKTEPDVQAFVVRMQQAASSSELNDLQKALAVPNSPENQIFTQYMRHLAYRPPRPPVSKSPLTKKEVRSVGGSTLDSREIIDRVMLRILENGETIPAGGASSLGQLLQGGMARVETRVGLRLVVPSFEKLPASEDAILGDAKLSTSAIFEHIGNFAAADGSVSVYTPTVADAKTMIGNKNDLRSDERALSLRVSNALVTEAEKPVLEAVLYQSKPMIQAVQKIEASLGEVPVGSKTWVDKTTLYRALINSAIYDEAGGMRGRGPREALVTAVIEHGDPKAVEATLRWLTLGRESNMMKGPSGRDALLAHEELMKFSESNEVWSPEAVRQVTDHLAALTDAGPNGISKEVSRQILEDVEKLSSQRPASTDALAKFFEGDGKKSRIEFGAHSVELKIAAESIDGRRGKVLEVSNFRDRYAHTTDTTDLETQLSKLARERGFIAIDFMEVRGINGKEKIRGRDGVYLSERIVERPRTLREGTRLTDRTVYSIDLSGTTRRTAMPVDLTELEIFLQSKLTEKTILIGKAEVTLRKRPDSSVELRSISDEKISDDHLRRVFELIKNETRRAGFSAVSIGESVGSRFRDIASRSAPEVQTPNPRTESTVAGRKFNADTAQLDRFLKTNVVEGDVEIGHFKVALKKSPFGLWVQQIDSAKPGSGDYKIFLEMLEQKAREAGHDALVIDVVSNPKQFQFYEKKLGYQVKSGSTAEHRSYFKALTSNSLVRAMPSGSFDCETGFAAIAKGLKSPRP